MAELDSIRTMYLDETKKDKSRYKDLEDLVENLEFQIKQRNLKDAEHARLNFSHLAIFIVFGGVIGFTVSTIVQKTIDRRRGKVKGEA
jgi:hypothetical protein